ncbi:hypothetical protein QTN25_002590 [Entamoeba marina]
MSTSLVKFKGDKLSFSIDDSALCHQISQHSQGIDKLNNSLSGISGQVEELRSNVESIKNKLESTFKSYSTLSIQMENLKTQIQNVTGQFNSLKEIQNLVEKLSNRINVAEENIKELKIGSSLKDEQIQLLNKEIEVLKSTNQTFKAKEKDSVSATQHSEEIRKKLQILEANAKQQEEIMNKIQSEEKCSKLKDNEIQPEKECSKPKDNENHDQHMFKSSNERQFVTCTQCNESIQITSLFDHMKEQHSRQVQEHTPNVPKQPDTITVQPIIPPQDNDQVQTTDQIFDSNSVECPLCGELVPLRSDLYRKWKLYGDADLSVYSVPFGISIKLSLSKRNTINPKSFNIPINTIQDVALLFKIAYGSDSLVDEITIMDKSHTFSRIFDRFGEDCDLKPIGLKDKQCFEKGMYLRNDGNTTYIIGTMYSSFYFIKFQTS